MAKKAAKSIGTRLDELQAKRTKLAKELALAEKAVKNVEDLEECLNDAEAEMEDLIEDLYNDK